MHQDATASSTKVHSPLHPYLCPSTTPPYQVYHPNVNSQGGWGE